MSRAPAKVGDKRMERSRGGKRYWRVCVAHRVWKYEHRVVAEEILGRPLEPGEQVCWVDGDTLNNSPENIEIRALAVVATGTRQGSAQRISARRQSNLTGTPRLTRAQRLAVFREVQAERKRGYRAAARKRRGSSSQRRGGSR